MSEEEINSNEEKNEEDEKEENKEEKEEDEKEENNEEKEDKEEKEENDNNEINIEDNAPKEEKDEEKNIENNENAKKESTINKFLQSKLKPSSEIKIDLKTNEINNNLLNKLNMSNQSILTAAFANSHSPIPFIPFNNPPIQLKSTLKIITDINREMDLLSSKLNKNISTFKFNNGYSSFNNNFFEKNYYNNSYDK